MLNRFHFIEKYSLLIVVGVACLFSFLNISGIPIKEWDEALYGVNAFEMIHSGDYFNLLFQKQPAPWAPKPPLGIWMMALSYKIFGYNLFGLRFVSALTAVISLVYTFKIVTLYKSRTFALFVIATLVTVNGVIGIHIGRTGDLDAPLVCFLICGIYHFLRYCDFKKVKSIYLFGIFVSLGFWVKGIAAFTVMPAIVLYCILKRKEIQIVPVLISFLILATISASWFVCIYLFGDPNINVSNELFFKQFFNRFSGQNYTNLYGHDYFFTFIYLDTKYNIWNYLFYVSILIFLYYLITKKIQLKEEILKGKNNLLIFSVIMFCTFSLFFTIVQNSHFWYMTPALPFVAIITAYGAEHLVHNYRWSIYIILGILVVKSGQKVNSQLNTKGIPSVFIDHKDDIKNASFIQCIGNPSGDALLYLYHINKNIRFKGETNSNVAWIRRSHWKKNQNKYKLLGTFHDGDQMLVEIIQ